MAPRKDISFKTVDGLTLRGWLFSPESSTGKIPCLVMSHGFTAVKEMDLDAFAEAFVSALPLACLVYDNRNFGSSDGEPRQEIIPAHQHSDMADAITYAQSLDEVDPKKIGIWGSSYSGGHVLHVGAVDKRVKAVLCQVPLVDGYANFEALVRPDFVAGMELAFQDDRHARALGKPPNLIPVTSPDPLAPSALPTPDSHTFFSAWETKSPWLNTVTLKSVEAMRGYNPSANIHRIAPTPLLMTIAKNDVLTPAALALEAFARAREPKRVRFLDGGHFDGYTGKNFEGNVAGQVGFLKEFLCNGV